MPRGPRRLEMGNKLAATLDEMLDTGELDPGQARALKDLAITFGVLTDKRRLEDGQATANVSAHVRVWQGNGAPTFLPLGSNPLRTGEQRE